MIIMTIYEDINDSRDMKRLIDALSDQGYSIDTIINDIMYDIKEDQDKYFNISAADELGRLDEDKLREAIISGIMEIADKAISVADKYDLEEYIKDEMDMSYIDDIDNDYESSGEDLMSQWNEEIHSMEQDYWNSRI